MIDPRRKPDPLKRSRSITMALLGAVTLCSCCCCLAPAPQRDEEVPAGETEGSDFGEPPQLAADGTPVPGTGTSPNQTTHATHSRPFYGGPFWLPLFFGNSGSSYRGGSGVNSPPRTQSPGGGVTTGGFGGTGRSMTGGSTGGGSSSS